MLRHLGAISLLALLGAGFAWWAVSDQLASVGGDNAVYVLTARHFNPLRAADPVAAAFARQSQYPPLYPLSLMPWADSLQGAHAATVAALVAALTALYAFALSVGLSMAWGAALVFLFAVVPISLREALEIHSEPLFISLSLAALIFLQRGVDQRRESCWIIGVGLAIAAMLTRTVGVTLFLPAALAAFQLRPSRRAWALGAALMVPLLAWHVLHHPATSYSTAWLEATSGNSAALLWRRMSESSGALHSGWQHGLALFPVLAPAADLLLLFSVSGAAWRLVRLRLDAVYLVAYLGVVAGWGYPAEAERFVWAVMPVALVIAFAASQEVGKRFISSIPWGPKAAAAAVLGLCAVVSLAGNMQRARFAAPLGMPKARFLPDWYQTEPADAVEYASTYFGLMAALEKVQQKVPSGDCIYSIKPAVVALATGRPGLAPPPRDVTPEAFDLGLSADRCRYMLALAYMSPSYPESLYPLGRLDAKKADVVFRAEAQMPDGASGEVGVLLRLNPVP